MHNSLKVIKKYDLENVLLTVGRKVERGRREKLFFQFNDSDFNFPKIIQKICDRANV